MKRALVIIAALAGCGEGDGPGGAGGGGGFGGTGGGGGGGSPSCSNSNCPGCCFNGACQAGSTVAACGKQGVVCGACANSQICRIDQSCGVDPNSTWSIQPTAAVISPTNNGSAWDGDSSAPDVSVFLSCPPHGASFDSQTPESPSYSPAWTTGACAGKASDLLSIGFVFQVFDIDALADDTITTPLSYVFTESNFVEGQVSFVAAGGMQSITMQLRRQ